MPGLLASGSPLCAGRDILRAASGRAAGDPPPPARGWVPPRPPGSPSRAWLGRDRVPNAAGGLCSSPRAGVGSKHLGQQNCSQRLSPQRVAGYRSGVSHDQRQKALPPARGWVGIVYQMRPADFALPPARGWVVGCRESWRSFSPSPARTGVQAEPRQRHPHLDALPRGGRGSGALARDLPPRPSPPAGAGAFRLRQLHAVCVPLAAAVPPARGPRPVKQAEEGRAPFKAGRRFRRLCPRGARAGALPATDPVFDHRARALALAAASFRGRRSPAQAAAAAFCGPACRRGGAPVRRGVRARKVGRRGAARSPRRGGRSRVHRRWGRRAAK